MPRLGARTPTSTCTPETGPIGFLGSNRNVDVTSDVWALFGELQIPVTERIQAQLSTRYEDYGGAVGSTFDPQARIKIELTDWLALRGGAGTTFRGPPPQNLSSDLVILTLDRRRLPPGRAARQHRAQARERDDLTTAA